jgi:hypothetical protein
MAYTTMLEMFVKTSFSEADKETAIGLLQSVYPCLEMTCELVGSYKTGLVEQCDDGPLPESKLAPYLADNNVDGVSFSSFGCSKTRLCPICP